MCLHLLPFYHIIFCIPPCLHRSDKLQNSHGGPLLGLPGRALEVAIALLLHFLRLPLPQQLHLNILKNLSALGTRPNVSHKRLGCNVLGLCPAFPNSLGQ